jgi:nucleoside-diphosphate-sugar epimerase
MGATMTELPATLADVETLEEVMTRPSPALQQTLGTLDGDIVVLGAGGKMGPTLCRLAKRAAPRKRVIAVARFSEAGLAERLNGHGVETVACDLLDRAAVAALPDATNVVYMAGRKFGSTGAEHLTWAMNALAPALVAERYKDARIVALSTGCVYPFWPVAQGGPDESVPPNPPPGEYAWSCVARERVFEHFSAVHGTAGRLIRLNYSIDMRYGVLHDVGRLVLEGAPVDVTMGHVNVVWQGDANAMILLALGHAVAPIAPLNVSGPETVSVRALAHAFGRRFGKQAVIAGAEAEAGWLNDASVALGLMGNPQVPLGRLIDWQADWLRRGLPSLGKPTGFQVRDGKF